MRCMLMIVFIMSSSFALSAKTIKPCAKRAAPFLSSQYHWDEYKKDYRSVNSHTVKRWGNEKTFTVGDMIIHRGYLNISWQVSEVIDISESGYLRVCDRTGDGQGMQYIVRAKDSMKYEKAQSYTYHKILAEDLIYNVGDKVRFKNSGSEFQCAISKIEDITNNGYFKVNKPYERYIKASEAYQYQSVSTYTDKRWGDDIIVNINDVVHYSEITTFPSSYTREARVLDISSDGYLTININYGRDPYRRKYCIHVSRVRRTD